MKIFATTIPRLTALPAILLAAPLLFSGCTTMRPVTTGEFDQLTSLVHVGDTVTCETHLGKLKTFKVTAVESGWLLGKSDRIYVADVKRVEVRHFSALKTVIFVVTVGAGGSAIFESLRHGWGGSTSGGGFFGI